MQAIAEAEPTAFRTEGEREAASEQAKRNVVKCATPHKDKQTGPRISRLLMYHNFGIFREILGSGCAKVQKSSIGLSFQQSHI